MKEYLKKDSSASAAKLKYDASVNNKLTGKELVKWFTDSFFPNRESVILTEIARPK